MNESEPLKSQRYTGQARPVATPRLGPYRVMVVEDEELMRSIIAQLLCSEGYTSETTADGHIVTPANAAIENQIRTGADEAERAGRLFDKFEARGTRFPAVAHDTSSSRRAGLAPDECRTDRSNLAATTLERRLGSVGDKFG